MTTAHNHPGHRPLDNRKELLMIETKELVHPDGCTARIESTVHPEGVDGDGVPVMTTRCLDCGAHSLPAPAVTGALAGAVREWHHGVAMTGPTAGQIDPDEYQSRGLSLGERTNDR